MTAESRPESGYPDELVIPDAPRLLLRAADALPAGPVRPTAAAVVAAVREVQHLEDRGPLGRRAHPAEVLTAWAALVPSEPAGARVADALDSLENRLAWYWPEALQLYREHRESSSSRLGAMLTIAAAFTREEPLPTLGVHPGQIGAYADVAARTAAEIGRLDRVARLPSPGNAAREQLEALREEDRTRWHGVVAQYASHSSGAVLRAWWALAPWAELMDDPRSEIAERNLARLELRLAPRQPAGMNAYFALRRSVGYTRRKALELAAGSFTPLDAGRFDAVGTGVTAERFWFRGRRVETVQLTREAAEMFVAPQRRGAGVRNVGPVVETQRNQL